MSNYTMHFPQLVDQNYYDGEITTRTIEDGKILLRSLFRSGTISRNYLEPLPSTIAEIKARRMR